MTARRRLWTLVVRGLGLAVLCAVLLRQIEPGSVARALHGLGVGAVALALLLGLLRLLLMGVRWMVLVPRASRPLRWWGYTRYTCLSNAVGLVLPGGFGGDIARSTMLVAALPAGRTGALISVLADRAVGLFSIVFMAGLAAALSPGSPAREWVLLLAGGASLAAALLVFWLRRAGRGQRAGAWLGRRGRVGASAEQIGAALTEIAAHGRGLWSAFALCFPIQLLGFWQAHILARALNVPAGFWEIALATALTWLVIILPISFAGLGLREVSYVYLMGRYGVSAESATALSLAVFAVTVLTAITGFVWLLFPAGHATAGDAARAREQVYGS